MWHGAAAPPERCGHAAAWALCQHFLLTSICCCAQHAFCGDLAINSAILVLHQIWKMGPSKFSFTLLHGCAAAQGVSFSWDVAMDSSNPQVVQQAMQLLLRMYITGFLQLDARGPSATQTFIRCVSVPVLSPTFVFILCETSARARPLHGWSIKGGALCMLQAAGHRLSSIVKGVGGAVRTFKAAGM
eukprot:scaffold86338_cov23-Tisochrysis_lutea.AAC.1